MKIDDFLAATPINNAPVGYIQTDEPDILARFLALAGNADLDTCQSIAAECFQTYRAVVAICTHPVPNDTIFEVEGTKLSTTKEQLEALSPQAKSMIKDYTGQLATDLPDWANLHEVSINLVATRPDIDEPDYTQQIILVPFVSREMPDLAMCHIHYDGYDDYSLALNRIGLPLQQEAGSLNSVMQKHKKESISLPPSVVQADGIQAIVENLATICAPVGTLVTNKPEELAQFFGFAKMWTSAECDQKAATTFIGAKSVIALYSQILPIDSNILPSNVNLPKIDPRMGFAPGSVTFSAIRSHAAQTAYAQKLVIAPSDIDLTEYLMQTWLELNMSRHDHSDLPNVTLPVPQKVKRASALRP